MAILRELQRYVNRTAALLPKAWRKAFVLHHVEGLSVTEVAKVKAARWAGALGAVSKLSSVRVADLPLTNQSIRS